MTADGPSRRASPDPIEADLLAQARGGSTRAFEEIVERHQRRVYAVARRIVRRHEVADDVTQETFIRAYQALDSFDLSRPFAPWICRIAANTAINHVRSKEFREEALPDSLADTETSPDEPERRLQEIETREAVAEALHSLPAEQRVVFVLRTIEELSYKEIAETLAISIGTVMSRLSRAREKLRQALGPRLRPEEPRRFSRSMQ